MRNPKFPDELFTFWTASTVRTVRSGFSNHLNLHIISELLQDNLPFIYNMGPRRRHRADQGAMPGINQPIPQNPVVLQDVSNAIE